MVYHVTILAGKMIENKASHDTQRVLHDSSRAVEYIHYYHKEKKTAKKTNKETKGKKEEKNKNLNLKKKKMKRRPRPRVRVLLTPRALHLQKSSQHVRVCAAGVGAICCKNRKIAPYHGDNPNTRNSALTVSIPDYGS